MSRFPLAFPSALLIHLIRQAWLCRLCVLSVVAGLAVFVIFSESHDLFLEHMGTAKLLKYTALISLAWVIQVYVYARLSILSQYQSRNEYKSRSYLSKIDKFIPIFLGLLCYVAVIFGILLSRRGILACEHVQDQKILETCLGYANVNTLLEWRGALERGEAHSSTTYSLPEVAAALAQLWQLAFFMAAAAVLFVLITSVIDKRTRRVIGLRLQSISADASDGIAIFPFVVPSIFVKLNSVIMGSLFVWAFYWPFELTEWAGRASLIPILLGSWIPVVALAGTFSRRLQSRLHIRWPLATTALVLLLIGSTYVETFHDIRTFRTALWQGAQADQNGQIDEARQRQIDLAPAIDRWMKLNSCDGRPADCRMILVAAEGGASRSAFFTATVLGALMDEAARHPNTYPDFSRAIFAMSGVSGGSVGLTLMRTALAESRSGRPPCNTADPIWFGVGADGKAPPDRDPTTSWRACLQLLAAGDFLSPTIVGLALRDQFALLVRTDRAALLEQSIERHFNHIVYGHRTACQGAEDQRGLCKPFGYLQQNADRWLPLLLLNAASKDTGRPILISDLSTAVTTKYTPCNDLFVVAHNAFELYATDPFAPSEPVADEMPNCVYQGLEKANDMRLSTAAVLSSRFPIITPAGSFRFQDEYRNIITANAVDGGYFDNSGVSTLNHIIPFLLERGIKPTVLYLTNDPWFYKSTERGGRSFAGQGKEGRILPSNLKPPEQDSWQKAFSLLVEPLGALYQTRAGHKASALETLIMRTPDVFMIPIRVNRGMDVTRWPDTAAGLCIDKPSTQPTSTISLYQPVMSWWLSPITQRVLDAQLCDQGNINGLRTLLERLQLAPS